MPEPSRGSRVLTGVAATAAVLGTYAAVHYAALGLTLSHYDARGHLIVARRVIDSVTPGWQQIGAVWLPLPHLLNLPFAQVDALYRSGLSAVALSVLSYVLAASAIAWLIASVTSSWAAAVAGMLVFALNPNVLYLQATPMTEPLLLALTVVAVALLRAYCADALRACRGSSSTPAAGTPPRLPEDPAGTLSRSWGTAPDAPATPAPPSGALAGATFAAACLTRYEAWPVAIGAVAAAVWVLWRGGLSAALSVRLVGKVAWYPIAAIAGFSVFSRVVVGNWFASGFFVPENPAQGHPLASVGLIVWGLRELSGPLVLAASALGLLAMALTALRVREKSADLLPLALLGMAAVPWSAFVDGHPYRIRYMVPLLAVQSLCAGVAAGHWKGLRLIGVPILLVAVALELRPLAASAPMVVEAQWDRPNAAPRARVTSCLQRDYAGDSVMASMGSLGHYMQDASAAGFALHDFLHEGNGDIWLNALVSPRPFAGWILIEEKAEGGDMLATRAREHPEFLDGYDRVCEGAGLALYRRRH